MLPKSKKLTENERIQLIRNDGFMLSEYAMSFPENSNEALEKFIECSKVEDCVCIVLNHDSGVNINWVIDDTNREKVYQFLKSLNDSCN